MQSEEDIKEDAIYSRCTVFDGEEREALALFMALAELS